jgi:hypothetical protein
MRHAKAAEPLLEVSGDGHNQIDRPELRYEALGLSGRIEPINNKAGWITTREKDAGSAPGAGELWHMPRERLAADQDYVWTASGDERLGGAAQCHAFALAVLVGWRTAGGDLE